MVSSPQQPLKSSLYLIGIGGTGAKCLEAIVHLAATGLFPLGKMKLLFVDADESNGNLERSRLILSNYKACYDSLQSTPQASSWLKTEVGSYGLWSPFGTTRNDKRLNSFFGYTSMRQNHPSLAHLFDVLYSVDEQKADLDVGFRGRPAIGAAVMSQINLDNLNEAPWSLLMNDIRQDLSTGRDVRIFLCGSIFGGTGASGLPTIGKLISGKLKEERGNEKVKIGGLFMLPYFQFSPVGADVQPNEVYARSENFLINTEAALRYYATQAEGSFDKVYLLGNENRSSFSFSTGKSTQKNAPHFLELYAALAVHHFLTLDSMETVALISRRGVGTMEWTDLPSIGEVRPKLVQAVRFAYLWLDNIIPEFNLARSVGVNQYSKIAWFPEFYRIPKGVFNFRQRSENLPDFSSGEEQQSIKTIETWCKDFLQWIYELHNCEGENVQFFLKGALKSPGGAKGEFLNRLVDGDPRDAVAINNDSVQNILSQLEDRAKPLSDNQKGTIGLAKILYNLCKL